MRRTQQVDITSPQDVELVQQGGAPVEDDGGPAVVPGRRTDASLIKTGLPRPVFLCVQPPVGRISARRGDRLRLYVGWGPGSGVVMSVRFVILRGTDVGLGVLVRLLHRAVVVVVVVAAGGGGCTSSQRGFGENTVSLSGFLAVVLHQPVALQGLFALVVEVLVARDGGQVTVLRPHSRG